MDEADLQAALEEQAEMDYEQGASKGSKGDSDTDSESEDDVPIGERFARGETSANAASSFRRVPPEYVSSGTNTGGVR
jgi:hypothetical protein